MYLLDFDFSDTDTRLFFAVIGLIVWVIIMFNVIKMAVRAAIQPLHDDILHLLDKKQKENNEK